MITETVTETSYFLPEDGAAAKAALLSLLRSPGETYLCAYGFTLGALVEEIKAADAAGVCVHLLLDHTQACGHTEAQVLRDLAASLKHGDITITTAGCGSESKSQIWHWKGMVVEAVDGGEPWCLEGSVNFSASGFSQGNSMRVFRSAAWAAAFLAQFEQHRAWARANEASYQIVSEGSEQNERTDG